MFLREKKRNWKAFLIMSIYMIIQIFEYSKKTLDFSEFIFCLQTVLLPFPFPNTCVWNHMYLEEHVFENENGITVMFKNGTRKNDKKAVFLEHYFFFF